MQRGPAVSKTDNPLRSRDRRIELPPAARRALAEAETRRREGAKRPAPPEEIGGRDGPNPVRYGDWEVKGIASDF
jgi:hypothetical protein